MCACGVVLRRIHHYDQRTGMWVGSTLVHVDTNWQIGSDGHVADETKALWPPRRWTLQAKEA